MENKMIFVGGIHGVGKTTLCNKLLKFCDINHYSASGLIKRLDKDAINDTAKTVTDIDDNQDKLVMAIDKYVDKGKTSLLDGHFCLLNSNYQVRKLPEYIFKNINLLGIIIIFDKIANIRAKNIGRDLIDYGDKMLTDFQCEELQYSSYIAQKLQISYISIDAHTRIDIVVDYIENLIKEKNENFTRY